MVSAYNSGLKEDEQLKLNNLKHYSGCSIITSITRACDSKASKELALILTDAGKAAPAMDFILDAGEYMLLPHQESHSRDILSFVNFAGAYGQSTVYMCHGVVEYYLPVVAELHGDFDTVSQFCKHA